MTQHNESDFYLNAVFNSLSGLDKAKLKAVVFPGILPRIIRDDIRQNRWKSAGYSLFLALYAQPIPLVPEAVAFTASMFPTKWSRWLRGRLKEPFGDNSLKERLPSLIGEGLVVPDPEKEGGWRVDNGALALCFAKNGISDTAEAGKAWLEGLEQVSRKDIAPALISAGSVSLQSARSVMNRTTTTAVTAFNLASVASKEKILPVLSATGSRLAASARSLWPWGGKN